MEATASRPRIARINPILASSGVSPIARIRIPKKQVRCPPDAAAFSELRQNIFFSLPLCGQINLGKNPLEHTCALSLHVTIRDLWARRKLSI